MKLDFTKFGIGLLLLCSSAAIAQTTIVTADYNKALWMTTRFYGGQRLTNNSKTEKQQNWLVQDYTPSGVATSKTGLLFAQDADAGYDLSGGWADCGDHVFFGQTGFYAGYVLLKNYDEFPRGFDDYYDANYTGYRSSGDYSWEGAKGTPNSIPDVLDEVKHQTDLFIKCAKNATTFYFEKGDGNADHTQRVTAVKMQTNAVNTGGEPRKMWSNPADASMPAMCAATLALMSRLYRPFDPAYADLCLVHAKYAYDYSMSKTGVVGAASGSFYGGNDNYLNGRAIMYAEMYLATGTASYKTTALALSAGTTTEPVRPNINYTFDYSNTGELALYCLASIGHTNAKSALKTHIENKFIAAGNYNAAGVYQNGGGWGKLRYVGNAALIVALYNKMFSNGTLDARVYANVDYILGKNSGSWSYISGFAPADNTPAIKIPGQIHHRNLYLYEGNDNSAVITIPTKNKQFGALVGGALDGTYNDVWTEYVNTEVCVDYNVGIVGALAAIKEAKDPVDTNKFFAQCSAPNLGVDKSLCGSTSIVLNSGLTNNNVRTFEWFKDGVSQGAASKTATTFTITAGAEWSVKVDSVSKCSRIDKVIISATLPAFNLGTDADLCAPANATLTTAVTEASITHVWAKDGATISGASTNSINITSSGTYKATISASGCASQTDQITFTSSLPTTLGDVYCPATNPNAQLQVVSAGGPFEWYAASTGGSALFTGKLYQVTPTSNKTYYVKDAGAFATAFAPATATGGTTEGGERTYAQFTAYSNFKLVSVDVIKGNYGGTGTESWQILLYTDNAGAPSTTVAFTGVATSFDKSEGDIKTIPVDIDVTGVSAGTKYWLTIKTGTAAKYLTTYSYTTKNQAVNGTTVIAQINQGRHDGANTTTGGMTFNWKISSGKNCDRVPVEAKLDCTVGTEEYQKVNIATIFPNPFDQTGQLTLRNKQMAQIEIYTVSGVLVDKLDVNNDVEIGGNLQTGVYIVKIAQGDKIQSLKFSKN